MLIQDGVRCGEKGKGKKETTINLKYTAYGRHHFILIPLLPDFKGLRDLISQTAI